MDIPIGSLASLFREEFLRCEKKEKSPAKELKAYVPFHLAEIQPSQQDGCKMEKNRLQAILSCDSFQGQPYGEQGRGQSHNVTLIINSIGLGKETGIN